MTPSFWADVRAVLADVDCWGLAGRIGWVALAAFLGLCALEGLARTWPRLP